MCYSVDEILYVQLSQAASMQSFFFQIYYYIKILTDI